MGVRRCKNTDNRHLRLDFVNPGRDHRARGLHGQRRRRREQGALQPGGRQRLPHSQHLQGRQEGDR